MEGIPLIETVYEAIETLYHNPDCNKKNDANRWLIDLQKSKYAWEIANELLQRQTDVDSCYFGAQMIRHKILFSFHELPTDAVISLHTSLMQQLSKINKETDNIIVTQLCVAVVDLTLQMSEWTNPVYSFLNQYNKIPHMVLLEILKVFPEEMETKVIRLGANRRNEIQRELKNCADLLNDYLKQVTLEDPSPEALLKAVKCFTSWVSIIKDISIIVKTDLMPKVFQILSVPPDEIYEAPTKIESRLHDAATDLLCCVLRCLRDSQANNILNVNVFSKIAAFENAYHSSVARESTEKSQNYCRIFSELGEAFLDKMIKETKPGNPHFSVQVLDLILVCVGHHDYEVSSITFNFWFLFAEMLYRRDDVSLCAEFKPYVNRLLIALCRQVQMEPDHEGLLEDNDDFKSFREKVFDLVRDVVFVVDSTNTFCQIFLSMQSSNPLTWDQIEASLFIMYAVAWKIDINENNIIPQTVKSVFNLPESTHIAIKYTTILIIGELREWFNEHTDYLFVALEFLERNLYVNELSDAAASSMCSICCTAKEKLKDLFSPLLTILKNLNSYNLPNKSAIAVIKGVTAVTSFLSPNDITIAMKEICWLQISPLQKLLESYATDNVSTNIDPVPWLDRLAAVFRFIEPSALRDVTISNDIRNACSPAFSQMQPILFQIMDHFQNDVVVMERCCRCIRFAIRTLSKSGVYLLPTLIEKLVEVYRAKGHSCFLYLGSILVDEYGSDCSNWDIILYMMNAFIEPTYSLLQNENCYREHPDTIDDLFRLCSRVLQRLPLAFFNSSSMWTFLEWGLDAVFLDHREANASVMKFFHETFDCSPTKDTSFDADKRKAVGHIYEKIGKALVERLVRAIVFSLPSYALANVAEVLYGLVQFDKEMTLTWIKSSVQNVPNQNVGGSLMALPEQIQTFLNDCEKADKTRDVLQALRDFTSYYQ
ncbi:hypothetical protein PGB90_006190 [Kerria lacca]